MHTFNFTGIFAARKHIKSRKWSANEGRGRKKSKVIFPRREFPLLCRMDGKGVGARGFDSEYWYTSVTKTTIIIINTRIFVLSGQSTSIVFALLPLSHAFLDGDRLGTYCFKCKVL